jgi:hypothetical protein
VRWTLNDASLIVRWVRRFFEEAGRTRPRLDFREPEFLRRLPEHLAKSHQFVHVVDPRGPTSGKPTPDSVMRNGRAIPATSVSHGMREADVVAKLRQFDHMRVLELSQAVTAFCGFDSPAKNKDFDDLVRSPLHKTWEFKYMETGKVRQQFIHEHTARPLSKPMEQTLHFYPSGGVVRAVLLAQILRSPPHRHTRPLHRRTSLLRRKPKDRTLSHAMRWVRQCSTVWTTKPPHTLPAARLRCSWNVDDGMTGVSCAEDTIRKPLEMLRAGGALLPSCSHTFTAVCTSPRFA